MKIRSLEADLFYADRRTDRHDEANSRFPKCCERTYKRQICGPTAVVSAEISGQNTVRTSLNLQTAHIFPCVEGSIQTVFKRVVLRDNLLLLQ